MNDAFNSSSIKRLCIPSNVDKLNDWWCNNTSKLIHIILSPNNPNYIFFSHWFYNSNEKVNSKSWSLLKMFEYDNFKYIF